MDLPLTIGPRVGNCGDDKPILCNITYLAEQCDKTANCNGFNANGFLKPCFGGRCGCELSSNSCPQKSNITDLYLKRGNEPPSEWKNSILSASLLYDGLVNISIATQSLCYQPEIGNGYLATNIHWDAMYIAGLFNGKCGSVHKARIPSTVLVKLNNSTQIANAVDLKKAVFIKRWLLNYDKKPVIIEQRFLAHRKRRHILIMQLSIVNTNNNNENPIKIYINDLFNLNSSNLANLPGNKCAGSFTNDFVFTITDYGNYTSNKPMIIIGKTLIPNDDNNYFNVTMVKDVIPKELILEYGQNYTFLTSITTSIPEDNHDALLQYNQAMNSLNNNTLIIEHEFEWLLLHESGIDLWTHNNNLEPTNDDLIGYNGIGLNFNTTNTIQRHINSSLYYLLSSIRYDWFPGVSPGGISTQNYQGAVFFDMDWYINPAFFLLNHNISHSLLEYRFISINASLNIAKQFGYNGSMYAWTAAYKGKPFGCCSGKGGYEDCLEQHITPDIAITTWNYYLVTRNRTWLKYRGWPLLSNIANWILSRVTKYNTVYNINDVLPVDEWCVGANCGCETPGVNNDAQTNAVCKLALKYAVLASKILNITNSNINLYETVYENIAILFNNTFNHHTQFNSNLCPNGYGGDNYTPRHTVCPEDVLYLSYPLNGIDELNITKNITNNDYNYFVPITCQENAGMTTPIHTIVQLLLMSDNIVTNTNVMENEFNRSMYAAAYGPYNIRNEVDKHSNIVGGHFDNTHFLTGNGGFIQQFVFGFSGIKIVQNGLKFEKSYLPNNIGQLRLRKLNWITFYMNVEIQPLNVKIEIINYEKGDNICFLDSNNNSIPLINNAFKFSVINFSYPGLLVNTKC